MMPNTQIKIIYLILGISLIISPQSIKAIEGDEFYHISFGEMNVAAGANCFDYYQFGSVEINLASEKTFYQAGGIVKFRGVIRNTNNYPISQGFLLAQIWRENLENPESGNYLIDEFFVLEDISLAPGGAKEVQFEWSIPAGMSAGQYFLATYFSVAQKLNVSGLSFVENVYGGITNFKIEEEGKVSEVIFDRSKVFFNAKPYLFGSFIPQILTGEKVKIDFVLKNLSQNIQEVEISKKLFRWDNLLEEQLQKEERETIKIGPQATKSFSVSFSNLVPDVYLFETVAKSDESKSILKTRFAVRGENPPARINFLGLGNFPLREGEESYIFVCFHSVLDGESFEGKIVTTLRDETGQSIVSTEYSGEISSQMMAMKKDFQPEKDYYNLISESFIFDKNGEIVDKISLSYNSAQFTDPFDFKIGLKEEKLIVQSINWWEDLVPAQMAIEVYDQEGNLVLFEPSFFGQKFEKPIELKEGENYQINVVSSAGIEKTASVFYPRTTKIWPIFLAFFLVIAIIIGIIIIRRYRQLLCFKKPKT